MQLFETSDDLMEKIPWKHFWKESQNRPYAVRTTAKQRKELERLFQLYIPLPSRQILALQKALSVGNAAVPGKLIKGSALQVEPLDVTLKLVTFDDKKIKLHKDFINGKVKRKNKKRKRSNGRGKTKLSANSSKTGPVRQIKLNKRSPKKSSIFSGRWLRGILRPFAGPKSTKKGQT